MAQRRVLTTSQSQHPAGIDWGNPICRGLVLAQGAGVVGNAVDGYQRPAQNSAPLVAKSGGVALQYQKLANQGTRYANFKQSLNPPVTLFARFYPQTSDTSGVVVSVGDGTGSAMLISRAQTTFNRTLEAGLWDGTNYRAFASQASLVPGALTDAAVRFYSASSFDTFLYGRASSVVTTSQGAAAFRPATQASTGNATHSFASVNDALDSSVLFSAAWNRALSDAEIRSISANPWQVFL